MVTATNPIMPGFYPDPSICAVGEDYYLINSTFAYFPGLSLMHSKDLAHWEQIGNVLTTESQLPLEGAGHSRGLFAPSIRYHNGTFYVACTNIDNGGNFVVTATNPEGPWSEPHYLEGADGIDPSLFFDDDGKCYYIGTHEAVGGAKYNGDWYIYVWELDLETMKFVGDWKNVWNGAMRNVIWPEGPHLYKKDGLYYIMNAEGGTGPDHAVTVCRSENIWGPYVNFPKNPILTHRHLGKKYPIQYVGHADIIETPKGEWYMVILGVRPLDCYTTMGRETFMARMIWEDGWPVVNPGVGMLTPTVEIDLPEWDPCKDPDSYTVRSGFKTTVPGTDKCYDFAAMKQLGDEFLVLRNPADDMYRFTGEGIELKLGEATLKEKKSPSYVCIRQQHHYFRSWVMTDTSALKAGECAGMALMQNDKYHVRVEADACEVKVILCENGEDKVLGAKSIEELKLDNKALNLAIEVKGLKAYGIAGDMEIEIPVSNLSTEVAGGFVGCTVGMYASANGAADGGYVTFKELGYKAM